MSTTSHKPRRTKSSFSIPTTPVRLPAFDYFSSSSSPDLATQHLSPTKAAAQTRLTHELTTLTTWLSSLFHPHSIPPHLLKWRDEVIAASTGTLDASLITHADHSDNDTTPTRAPPHNALRPGDVNANDVLTALQSLKQLNLQSTHLTSLLHEASLEELTHLERLALQTQQQRADNLPARTSLDDIHTGLSVDGRAALTSLCQSAVILGLEFPLQSSEVVEDDGNDLTTLFAKKILELARRKIMLSEQVRELGLLQKVIDGRLVSMNGKRELGTRMDENDIYDEQAEQIRAQTVQFNRDIKQINLKIMEYEDRVKGLERHLAGPRTESADLQNVLEARQRVEERRASVAALQQRVAAFHGLPPELEASRNEVRRAMAELDALKKRREGLFERMGNG